MIETAGPNPPVRSGDHDALAAGAAVAGAMRWPAMAVLLLAIGRPGYAVKQAPGVPFPAATRWHDVSLDDYRKHLTTLIPMVGACAKGRDLKSCDPALVGPDDRVPLAGSGSRLIRYGWLRVLLSKAEDKDTPPETRPARAGENAAPAAPATSQLLEQAQIRLAQDLAQAGASADAPPNDGHAPVRAVLKQVLAGREFRGLEDPTLRDSAMEKIGNWLNRLLDSATRFRARSAWVGRAMVWGFILAVCGALGWMLARMERRWRLRLLPDAGATAADAPSARGWQSWLTEARTAAAEHQWREAIHSVYWASIARLEARRLWPADRARTPREYLALVDRGDPRRAGLDTLTRSFERTWYGGRHADETDYRSAEQVAARLMESNTVARADAAPGGRK